MWAWLMSDKKNPEPSLVVPGIILSPLTGTSNLLGQLPEDSSAAASAGSAIIRLRASCFLSETVEQRTWIACSMRAAE